MRHTAYIFVLGAALAACGGPTRIGQQRFENRAPVWKVNDRLDVPEKPETRPYAVVLDVFDSLFHERVVHALEVPRPQPALDVNALGEVPDSTWFENRIGTGELSPAEVARGPNQSRGPDLSEPMEILSSKVGGVAVGFIVRDAQGDRWVVKFDSEDTPILETANEVIVQRLLWAAGYHVPENSVVYFRPEMLQLTEDAKFTDSWGHSRPLTRGMLEDLLDEVYSTPDGRLRALASRFLPGEVVGGFPKEGVRPDDPNDVIPHQHRRSLRGMYVFFSWVQHTDVKENNTADVYVEDPSHPGRHFVMHYLLDFGKALGAFVLTDLYMSDAFRYNVDPQQDIKSLLSLGLWTRPWESIEVPDLPGLGAFDAEHYDPDVYRPHRPYVPFWFKDRHDMYWAAKILAEFTPAHIRAAVEQGRLPHRAAEDYLVRVLVARQKKALRHWFSIVNPVDEFAVRPAGAGEGHELCFRDLLVHHDLAPTEGRASRYRVTSYDYGGDFLGWSVTPPLRDDGEVCAAGFTPASDREGYTILRIDTWRGDERLDPVEVHVARGEDGELRVIGVNRR